MFAACLGAYELYLSIHGVSTIPPPAVVTQFFGTAGLPLEMGTLSLLCFIVCHFEAFCQLKSCFPSKSPFSPGENGSSLGQVFPPFPVYPRGRSKLEP